MWFAAASLAAGLFAALAAAALVVLLARPAYAGESTAAADCQAAAESAADEECARPIFLILGREEELERLGLECEAGVEGGAHPTEHGFLRLLDRDRRELGDLLREVDGSARLRILNELTDEAHVVRLAGAEDVAGQDVAHCLVYADRALEALRAFARVGALARTLRRHNDNS